MRDIHETVIEDIYDDAVGKISPSPEGDNAYAILVGAKMIAKALCYIGRAIDNK